MRATDLDPRAIARGALGLVRGGRKRLWLAQKRAYHAARAAAELRVLGDPDAWDPGERVCPYCCDPGRTGTVTNALGARFARCATDGAVYLARRLRPEAVAALGAAPHEDLVLEGGGPDRRAEAEVACARVPGLTTRTTLLDIGAGAGSLLAALGSRVEGRGCEPHPAAAARARARGLDVVTATVQELPAASAVDVATLVFVLEHALDPVALLREVRARVRPGGHVYLVTPELSTRGFAALGGAHFMLMSMANVSLGTEAALRTAVAAAGLEVVWLERFGDPDVGPLDRLTYALAPTRFRHRMACYSPRLLALGELAAQVARGLGQAVDDPPYLRAVLTRPGGDR